MDYRTLSKLYYQNKEQYNQQLTIRKSSPSAVLLDFEIHSDQAFYLVTPELFRLQSSIYQSYIRFLNAFLDLPDVAQDCYCRRCLVDEIILTNDLEGVRSTRRDVLTVIQSEKKSDKKKRFEGLVKKYVLLTEAASIPLSSLKDIRELYDDIVAPEIDFNDLPDGTYFRKGGVDLVTATDKVKHRGISGESHINEAMTKALAILKDSADTPLLQVSILHYLIGYIHPYYDGNGRLSRFISSYLLSRTFHPIVAYRLSYTIKQNKAKYYNAFDYVNDRNSGGDITPFIILFTEMIEESILSLEEKVNDVSTRLDYYHSILSSIKNEDIQNFLFYFIQNSLFSPDPFTLKELSNISGKSIPTVRRILDSIKDAGIPLEISKNGHANIYRIDDLDALSEIVKNLDI